MHELVDGGIMAKIMKKLTLAIMLLSGIANAQAQDCLLGSPPHSQGYLDCVFYMKPTAGTITSSEEAVKLGKNIAAYCTAAVGW
jgi:hypothetical protein